MLNKGFRRFCICAFSAVIIFSSHGEMITVNAANSAKKAAASKVVLNGLVPDDKGDYYYYINGVMQKGWVTIGTDVKYFDKKDGKMYFGVNNIDKKNCYFDENGSYVAEAAFNKNGSLKHGFFKEKDGKRYYENGVMLKGFAKIKDKNYYFDEDTGVQGNYEKAVNSKLAPDEEPIILEDSEFKKSVNINGVIMSGYYEVDPEVDDRTLLAGIICCEASTQKKEAVETVDGLKVYKGQLAVGYVVSNRMDADKLSLKDTVYKKNQFAPANNGRLGRMLETPDNIPESCYNAADVVLAHRNQGLSLVEDFTNEDFTWGNFWGLSYAKNKTNFFSVYKNQDTDYEIIQDHVFFNYSRKLKAN